MSRKYKRHLTEEGIGELVTGAASEVHRTLGGPGFLACVYEEALLFELQLRGVRVERRMVVPFVFKGRRLSSELRINIVERKVLVDCRAAPESLPFFASEAAKHLRLLDLPLAVVINFGARDVTETDGVRYVTNTAMVTRARRDAAS